MYFDSRDQVILSKLERRGSRLGTFGIESIPRIVNFRILLEKLSR